MADVHFEEGSSPSKTAKEAIAIMVLTIVVSIVAILLIMNLVTGGMRIDPDSLAMSEDSIAKRLKPVGEVNVAGWGSRISAGTICGIRGRAGMCNPEPRCMYCKSWARGKLRRWCAGTLIFQASIWRSMSSGSRRFVLWRVMGLRIGYALRK